MVNLSKMMMKQNMVPIWTRNMGVLFGFFGG